MRRWEGISTYVPRWVKTNPRRFPRAKLRKSGGVLQTGDVISIFHHECRTADAKAFGALLAHLKEFDEAYSTVVMVQVENETGLLGDSRDGCPAAEDTFGQPVPQDLLSMLARDWAVLHPDLKENLATFRAQCTGNSNSTLAPPPARSWASVFGKGPATDELFMAYHYSRYLNDVAAAGKAAYPLPFYANVWQNYSGDAADHSLATIAAGGVVPGDYPSGGGTSNVLDIWQVFAPNLDFIAPDVYLNDYGKLCAKYRHRGQPLFIPEQRRDENGARRIWIAFGSFAALGTAPFGIDTLEPATTSLAKHYGLLDSISAIVLDAHRRPGSSVGFCFDELHEGQSLGDPSQRVVRNWGG